MQRESPWTDAAHTDPCGTIKKKIMRAIERDCAWHIVNCRLYITPDVFHHKMDFCTLGHNCRLFPSATATGCHLWLLQRPLWPDKSLCTNPSLSTAHFCNLLKFTIHIKLAFSRLVYGNKALRQLQCSEQQ